MSILGSARMARAIVSSCICPCEILVTFVDFHGIAFRQRMHEMIDMGGPARRSLPRQSPWPAIPNVFHNRGIVEPGIRKTMPKERRKSARDKSRMS